MPIILFNQGHDVSLLPPSRSELELLVRLKHGDPAASGWGVQRRWRHRYFTPDDHYEALVRRLIEPGAVWLDVGGGASLFPHNAPLAAELAQRCRHVIGVDPSPNLNANPFVHERHLCLIEEYQATEPCDVATLRMVAEHIHEPARVIEKLRSVVRPGGLVVIYTVNAWAPLSLLARAVPFGLHHPIKRLFWGGEEKDTFPVVYRMNSRAKLRHLFRAGGFEERLFLLLDDLATFSQIRALNWLELAAWRVFRSLGLRYPESCILGVYG